MLPILSTREVVNILKRIGFEDAPKRGKGSHVALVKRDQVRTRLVIIPQRKTIPRGTLRAILEQAGLTRDEFIRISESK